MTRRTSEGTAPSTTAALVVHALRRGTADDAFFDLLLPSDLRAVSWRFWTPVAVARRAGELLEAHGVRRVIDVGSGCGKFCLAAAAVTPAVSFWGIEQRENLVEIARRLATRMALPNVEFSVGDATDSSKWDSADAFYLFNPFAENGFDAKERLDGTVELSRSRSDRDVARVELALRAAAIGTRVVTYHGFGGRMPDSYDLVRCEAAGTDDLCLWVKVRLRASDDNAARE
jgi:SAM-dependent methyltransferase